MASFEAVASFEICFSQRPGRLGTQMPIAQMPICRYQRAEVLREAGSGKPRVVGRSWAGWWPQDDWRLWVAGDGLPVIGR